MGLYVTANIVKIEEGKVVFINEKKMPESNPIYALNDLFFRKKLKNSFQKIGGKELDLSFFTKSLFF